MKEEERERKERKNSVKSTSAFEERDKRRINTPEEQVRA